MHAEGKNGLGECQWRHVQLKHAGLFVEVEYFTQFSCLSQNTIFQEEKNPTKQNRKT